MITKLLWDKAYEVSDRFEKERQAYANHLMTEEEWMSSCEELCEEFYSIIKKMNDKEQ